jgi:hypothetical protein
LRGAEVLLDYERHGAAQARLRRTIGGDDAGFRTQESATFDDL